jgi:6-phosphogluconolactonase
LATEELSLIASERLISVPLFDLILLGMGEDGHVASLFPGDIKTANDQKSIFLAIENSPKPPPQRVTLGHGPIAKAHEIWVLASGQGKEAALRESLSKNGGTPLARVIQHRQVTKVFTDIRIS